MLSKRLVQLIIIGIVFLIISLSFAISVGSVSISTEVVWGVLINKFLNEPLNSGWSKGHEAIVWNIRFPRALLALMVAQV